MNVIVTLANDRTLDWMYGLVGSLRRVGSEMPIRVIPYDGQVQRLEKAMKGFVPVPSAGSKSTSQYVPFLHWAGLGISPQMGNWHLYFLNAWRARHRASAGNFCGDFTGKPPAISAEGTCHS